MSGKLMDRHHTAYKWVGLAIGCLAKFVSGSLFVFNAYEDALKTTFNFTAKEIQLQSSFLNVGLGVGFLPGMFYDRFGPQWCSVVGLVLSLAAYLLIWSTTKSISFYSSHSWLMALYFFLSGLGSMFTYMVALNTNAINFNSKHRGKIIGILNAFFAGSPSVFSALYFHVIGKDNPKSVDSFSTLMLVFAVSFVVIDILCIGFLRVFPNEGQLGNIFLDVMEKNSEASGVQAHNNGFTEDSNTTDALATSNNTLKYVTDSTNTIVNAEPDDVSMIKILLNVDNQLLTWVITSASVAGLVFTIALTQTTSAIGLASHNADIVLIIPITNGVISAAVGIISDYFKQRLPRLGIFVAGNFTFVICQCLVVGLADEYPVLVIATVFNGIGQGILWSIAPTVMSEIFSIKNLGRNWGIALLVSSLVGFAAQEAFGALYDAGISVPGEVYCYGMSCVRGGHAVTLGITAMSMVLGVILYIRRRRGQKQ